MMYLALFVALWIGIAVGVKQRGASITVAAGGSFLVSSLVVALVAYNLGPDTDPAAEPEPDIVAATAVQAEHVSAFLEDGYTLRHAYSVESDVSRWPSASRPRGYFVAAEIVGSGGYVGVWWHGGDADKPLMTMAVDHIADEACVCQWSRNTQAGDLWADSTVAKELKSHVENVVTQQQ